MSMNSRFFLRSIYDPSFIILKQTLSAKVISDAPCDFMIAP